MAKAHSTTRNSLHCERLILELMQDYDCPRDELHARLDAAREWADRHGVQFQQVTDEAAEGVGVESGAVVCPAHLGEVHRLNIDYMTDATAFEQPAHHELLEAALALFLYSHPVTKRQVEAMPLGFP